MFGGLIGLGILLLIIGFFVASLHILWVIGVILVIVGVVMYIMGRGRRGAAL